MGHSLEEIQHFGITVRHHKASRHFYKNVLRLPSMAATINRGTHAEKIYRLKEAVNYIDWYQIGDGGMETFYLPRHPSAAIDVSDTRSPGYKYIAFMVEGFDDYAKRLATAGQEIQRSENEAGRCLHLTDPDGVHILLFDTGRHARVGNVVDLKEAGLFVADPEGYKSFFDIIGLWKIENDDPGFIQDFFGIETSAPLFAGGIRLVFLPSARHPVPRRCFPARHAEPRIRFCDAGIQHTAFYVHDIDSFHTEGKKNGIVFLFEPVRVRGGSRITYFLDPEGNTFEAMQVPGVSRTAANIAGSIRRTQVDMLDIIRNSFGNPNN